MNLWAWHKGKAKEREKSSYKGVIFDKVGNSKVFKGFCLKLEKKYQKLKSLLKMKIKSTLKIP